MVYCFMILLFSNIDGRRRSSAKRPAFSSFGGIFRDEIPIDYEAKAGLIAYNKLPVVQMRVLAEQAEMQRVGFRTAMRLDPKGAARHRQHEMTVDFGRSVRRDDGAVLLGELGDAQRLGKAGGAGRVELHVADAANGDEVAHRETG